LTILQLAAADDVIAFHLDIPVEDIAWTLRGGFFIAPALAFWVTAHVCVALQRGDRRRLRAGLVTGISARAAAETAGVAETVPEQRVAAERSAADGQGPVGYTAVSAPLPEEERIRLIARRPDELITPIPRHLVPLSTPRRAAAQVRARLNHLFLLSRLEGGFAHQVQHAEQEPGVRRQL
jgi:ubiquinol-cytochrome c reductase cytochrome b subunit